MRCAPPAPFPHLPSASVGESMSRCLIAAPPPCLVKAVWRTQAPAEERLLLEPGNQPLSLLRPGQGQGLQGRLTGSGRCPQRGQDRMARGSSARSSQGPGWTRLFPGRSGESGEKPGITLRSALPGMKNQGWNLPPTHGLWSETPVTLTMDSGLTSHPRWVSFLILMRFPFLICKFRHSSLCRLRNGRSIT